MIHLLWNKFISEHGCVHQRSGLCSPPSSCGSELSKTCPLVYFCFTLTYCVKDYHIMSNIRVDYPVCLHFRRSKGPFKISATYSQRPELRFVATVTTGGHVKFVPAVWIFPEDNAISGVIWVETVRILYTQLISNKKSPKITDINTFTLFLFE